MNPFSLQQAYQIDHKKNYNHCLYNPFVMDGTSVIVDSLTKSYSNEPVLQGIDLEIPGGEFCVVVGPSGCGKTTLLDCIAGLIDYEGEVTYDGAPVDDLSPERRDIGYVFQEFEDTLFAHMTVEENISFALEVQDTPRTSEEQNAAIDNILETLAISDLRNDPADELSGGQQQRVELARQLVRNCDLVLLDDPLSDLDYKLQKQMEFVIRQLHRESDSTFIYVTHNQDQALKLATKLVVMKNGKVEQAGAPESVYKAPETAFVGEFIGDSNTLDGTVTRSGGDSLIETDVGKMMVSRKNEDLPDGAEVRLLVRPRDISIDHEANEESITIDARLESRIYTGKQFEFVFSVEEGDQEFIIFEPTDDFVNSIGERHTLSWRKDDMAIFRRDTENTDPTHSDKNDV